MSACGPIPPARIGQAPLLTCRTVSANGLSGRRQHQLGPQSADRRGAERQRAAIERREIDHDREAKARAGLGLVEPVAAARAPGCARAATGLRPGPSSSTTTRSVCGLRRIPRARSTPRPSTRDCAHLQALSTRLPTISSRSCRSPRKRVVARRLDVDRDAAVAVDLLHRARQRRHDRRDLGDGADHGRARRDAGALEMVLDLVAHHVGLLAHLGGERIVAARGRLVDDHRERRLQRMREIADMRAGALDDLAVRVDQRIGLARERRDLLREAALEPFGGAGADRRKARRKCASAVQGRSAPGTWW